jgi:ABC-type dipeptide/oligopeptide/nickel transport system ATPase subunit
MALVTAENVRFRYAPASPWTLLDVSLTVEEGQSVGIVGESGSGKSTLIRLLSGMLTPQEGTIIAGGKTFDEWSRHSSRELHRFSQLVFQSPRRSFDPRMRLGRALSEPTRAIEGRRPRRDELELWMTRVGLDPELLDRYPHQLSGGQLQRISLARAISVGPQVLYADEPTSSLDVSVQAQVLNVLMDLRAELGITLVTVTHDLAVVGRMCEKIIVISKGEIVEEGTAVDVLTNPQHEYTIGLVEAAKSVSLKLVS